MDFGDYDVLGDILSDGSADSFFEESKPTTKSSSTTRQRSGVGKQESYQDEETIRTNVPESKGKIDWLGLDKADASESDKNEPLTKIRKPTKKISFEDDDILGSLGFADKPEKIKRGESPLTVEPKDKKIDMLEGILKTNTKEPSEITKSDVNTDVQNQFPSFAREGRRKRVTSGLMDPLGLFSDQPNEERTVETKQTRTRSFSSGDTKDIDALSSTKSQKGDTRSVPNILEPQGTPGWLGLAPKSKSSDSNFLGSSYTKSKSDITLSDKTESTTSKSVEKTEVEQHFRNPMSNTPQLYEQLIKPQVDFESSAIFLQQQESQVLIALQMKKYEESLMQIQRQQQEIILKQDQHFSALLEKQFSKQNAIENNLKLQQERINNHIQLLLTQPRLDTPITHLKEEIDKTRETVEEEYLKANENLINNLKQRHHEELFILEESYKKQISVLEDSSQQVESRLKAELELVLSQHESNVAKLRENHEKELESLRKKIEEVQKQHVEEMKLVRDNHIRVIDEMKYEHNILLENLKESRRQESSITKESGEHGRMLEANIQLLHSNRQILQTISGKVETQYEVVYNTREEAIKGKEKEIEMMRNTLDKCRESAEIERSHLLGLVRSLESKIAELNQTTREERWAMQQAVSTLAARSSAFDREMEFSRASIEREREQIKTLKESLLAEQERTMLQMTEEKLAITEQKARLQTSNKLNIQFDTQKAKVELETAIQVAKEAAEMTDHEREHLQRRILEVESLKRVLKDKERKISSKEEELTELIQMSEYKYTEGERALKDAKITEAKCNEKMRLLQTELLKLTAREKKISEEQLALSKERLALNTMMRQRQYCRLCSVKDIHHNQQTDAWSNGPNNDIQPHFDISEAEIFRLQFEDKEEEPTNTNKYL